jgi:uncharacterized protein (TIRG00374 family)
MNETSRETAGSPVPPIANALIWVGGLSALGYVGISLWAGWETVVSAVTRIGVPLVLVGLALSLVNYGLRFLRWHFYLGIMGCAVPWRANLRIYVAGFALTISPGKVGETVRSVMLRPYRVEIWQSLAAFVSERLSDLLGVIVLSCMGLWTYQPARPYVAFAAALVALGVAFMYRGEPVLARLGHWLPGKSGRLLRAYARVNELLSHCRRCYTPRALLYGVAVSVAGWGAEAFAFYLFTKSMGYDLTLATATFIYSFSILVGALSFLPGGLGGTEAAMIGLLALNGVPEATAVAVTLIIRLVTLWFAVLLGVIAMPGRPSSRAAT